MSAALTHAEDAPPVALRETMRVAYGHAPLLERHLARLAGGGAGPTLLSRVREVVAEQLASPEANRAYVRLALTVTPDGAVAAGIGREPSSLAVAGGPILVPVAVAGPPTLPPEAAKPASRRYWDRAHRAAQLAGGDQALLHLADGAIVDGSTANVWLLLGGELLTPPAPPAIAGVARSFIFAIAHELGIPASERPLTLDDFSDAEEVLLSNAVGGIVAARGRSGDAAGRLGEQWARLFKPPRG